MRKKLAMSEAWQIGAVVIVLFVVLCVVLWVLGSMALPRFLEFDPSQSAVSMQVFHRAQVLLYVLAAALIGALCYIAFVYYLYTKKSTRIAEAMVADLALSTHQLQLLYDNSPVPYFVMDDAGNVRNANKATLRFFSATPEDMQVANFFSLVSNVRRADAAAGISLFISKIQRGIAVTDEEILFRTYDEQERFALVSIYSLDKSSPMPYKHLVALHDVTKERENEQVKTDFLLLASHQLRTPTTTIKWYADYLLETKTLEISPEVREYLEEIYHANERMTDLIATLLTVSHIEMGTLAPEYAPTSLDAVIDDVLRELAPDIEKKHHTIQKDLPKEATVVTDTRMIRIAIHNLLTNAIKYTHQKGTVEVRVAKMPYSTTISVTDSGCGIPLDEQERIFSKMFRATNAKKMAASGTGLGLYLTKSFVEKLGGSISFTSTEGKGTVFTITLPNVAPDA